MKRYLSIFVNLVLFLILLLPRNVAFADIAPPPITVIGGLGAFEYQSTNVQMSSERVEMEIIPYRYEYEGESIISHRIKVSAWFIMHNMSDQDESMDVIFPLDNLNRCDTYHLAGIPENYSEMFFVPDSFEAQVNGKILETSTITTNFPLDIDGYCGESEWADFYVFFPADKDVEIRVSYLMGMIGMYEGVSSVAYTLETGAAWKGPIGDVKVIFRFPYTMDDFILPGTSSDYIVMQNEISWHYTNIEPTHQDNISTA